jgi:hypothetical protein
VLELVGHTLKSKDSDELSIHQVDQVFMDHLVKLTIRLQSLDYMGLPKLLQKKERKITFELTQLLLLQEQE